MASPLLTLAIPSGCTTNTSKQKETIEAAKRSTRRAGKKIKEIRKRGVPIAEGYGENIWDLEPDLDKQVHALYEDAKISLWTELPENFTQTIPSALAIQTQSKIAKTMSIIQNQGKN